MFLYPMFYHLGTTLLPIFKNQNSYGVYVGSTIHEVAQVFAAGQAIGPKAADTAVIVKMIRVMMLAAYFGDCDRLFRDNPITSVSHL